MKERSRTYIPNWRTAILAALVAAALCASANDAQAIGVNDGCAYYNGKSGDTISDTLVQGGFKAGDRITYTLTPASANTIVVSFLRVGAAASETTYPGLNTVRTETFEIPASDDWQLTLTSTSSLSFHYEIACTPAASGTGPGSSEADSAGYANTVRSAARSQTEVLEKNLDSRIDAAFQAAAGRDFGGPADTPGQRFAALARSYAAAEENFFDGPALRSRSADPARTGHARLFRQFAHAPGRRGERQRQRQRSGQGNRDPRRAGHAQSLYPVGARLPTSRSTTTSTRVAPTTAMTATPGATRSASTTASIRASSPEFRSATRRPTSTPSTIPAPSKRPAGTSRPI